MERIWQRYLYILKGPNNRINSDRRKLRRYAMQLSPAGYAGRYLQTLNLMEFGKETK
jgi:hypothetical protein